jgi:signal transduction histidine kinase
LPKTGAIYIAVIRYFNLLLLFSLISCASVYSQGERADILEINSIDELLLIGKSIEYFEDKSGELTIDDIQKKEIQSKFTIGTKDIFARPATSSVFWFRFAVSNNCSEDIWLEVGSTYAWYIDLFKPDSLGTYKKIAETGTMRPEDTKFYKTNLFLLPLNKANQAETITYYLKVSASLPLELPLHIGTTRALSRNNRINGYLTAGFVGLIAIIFLYSLFIFISTKDKVYIWYLGYLLLMGISMPYANSHPFIQNVEFWFIDKTWWNNYFLVWHAPAYFFVGMFCIKYLNLKETLPKVYKLMLAELIFLVVVSPLLLIFVFELVEIINIFQVVVLLLYLSCLFSAYFLMFKGHKYARYYALGWTFMIVHVFIFFATVNGFLPFNHFTRNSLYVGVGLEVWMFSLALGDRINLIRKEKEETQKKYIELVESKNESLANIVSERTEELENALEEVEAANSELMAQAENLAELNKTKDKLLSIIGHDLKAPIGQLKLFLDLVLKGNMDAEGFKKLVGKFNAKVDSILFLLNNLLQWASSQRDGISAKPLSINLYEAVEQNILLLNKTIETKKLNVRNNIISNAFVYFDSTQLNIIILNLLNNAVKFTNKAGYIAVESEILDKYVQVKIVDTGVGMDKETQKKLFDPYLQISKEGTAGEAGTGLGLAICKDFIERGGGKIWVESEPLKGSRFYFTLPVWGR